MSQQKLASVDVGDCGNPGSVASQIICEIRQLKSGRYEAKGSHSVGCNQGYYQENYSHGPWRGRGDTVSNAIAAMLEDVPEDYLKEIRQAAKEAMYQLEDDATNDD